jgi:hypothetical protein
MFLFLKMKVLSNVPNALSIFFAHVQQNRFVYMDFAQLEEEELDVDYEIDQEGLNQALEEATAMAAAQLTSTPPYMTYPNGGASVPSGRMVRASGWCRSQRFPVKLYALLSQPQLSHIITWMPHGRSWKVLKPREFEASILPGTSHEIMSEL